MRYWTRCKRFVFTKPSVPVGGNPSVHFFCTPLRHPGQDAAQERVGGREFLKDGGKGLVGVVPVGSVPKGYAVCIRVGVRCKVEFGTSIAALEPRDGGVAQNARPVVQHPLFVWAECREWLWFRAAGCRRGFVRVGVWVVRHGTTINRAAFCPQRSTYMPAGQFEV
jgi:hypothetical protein